MVGRLYGDEFGCLQGGHCLGAGGVEDCPVLNEVGKEAPLLLDLHRHQIDVVVPLTACAFVLVPHQPASALGVELLILGLLVLGLLLLIVVPALRGPSGQPTTWRAARIVGIAVATVPIMLAGASCTGWWWACWRHFRGHRQCLGIPGRVVRDRRYRPVDVS